MRIVIGNKCDMGSPFRVVSEEEGKELASRFGVEYIETSAKNSINVSTIFDKMAASILSHVYANPTIAIHPKLVTKGKTVKKGRCC